MISFACPRCKAEYCYDEDMAGQKIRCLGPKCGQKLLVPSLATPTLMNAPAAADRAVPRRGRSPDATQTPDGPSGKLGERGPRERLFMKRLSDLYLKVKGLTEAPAGGDMQRELMTNANDLRQLTEMIDAKFSSSF